MKLKTGLVVFFIAVFCSNAFASKRVGGYTKKNGTYVAPHHRTDPNRTQRDNYSSKPNVNPHTGKRGTKEPTR